MDSALWLQAVQHWLAEGMMFPLWMWGLLLAVWTFVRHPPPSRAVAFSVAGLIGAGGLLFLWTTLGASLVPDLFSGVVGSQTLEFALIVLVELFAALTVMAALGARRVAA